MTLIAPSLTEEIVALIKDTEDDRPWIREKAVIKLVNGGYGHHVRAEILASTPVRSRYKGRFCSTRHIESLYGGVLDGSGTIHSVWFCPAAKNSDGNGTWTKNIREGWLCTTCIHTQDWTEIVADERRIKRLLMPERTKTTASKTKFYPPKGERARKIFSVLERQSVMTMIQILSATSHDPMNEEQVVYFTLYRMVKTGSVIKSGRGKKAIYRIAS